MWLHQVESGSEKRIVEPQPLEYVGLTVSPDSEYIYASTFKKNEIDPLVFKIPYIGGAAKQVPNVATGSAITISPDGKRFAFTTSNNREKETLLGVADIDGANVRYLIDGKHDVRYFSMFKSSPSAWSPDGAEVAVAVIEKNLEGPQAAILMVDPNDGRERYLTEKRWWSVDNLAWVDANKLAFIAQEDENLQAQIWLFSRETGEVKQLTNELRKYVWLAAAKGKILAVQVDSNSSLRIADFDESEQTIAIREVFSASDYIDEIDWSKTGDIIYSSRAGGKSELWQVRPDGTDPKQLTFDANVTFGLAVSPFDGSLIFASKQNGIRGIWQSDAEGKNLRQLSDGADQLPDVSNDGKIVFHRGLGYAEGVFITAQGENNARMLKEKCYFPAISPDSSQVACYFMDWEDNRKWRIALVSAESGDVIRKLDLPIPIYERQIRWHSSGKYITQIYTVGDSLNLLLLPVDGGEFKTINGLGNGASNLPEWSPDGRQFLYSLIKETQDAVLLTGF